MKRHWHPTPAQTLLLHAALDSGSSSVAAWDAWRKGGGDIQKLDHLSARLLPLIARNLVENGVPEPELGLLRGVRKYSWVQHVERVRCIAPFAGALVAAGLQVVFLKGIALAPLYYSELGLRMFTDVDVLVHPADVPRAVAVLAQHGVLPSTSHPRSLRRALAGQVNLADQGYQHGLPFSKADQPDGFELDLHWSVMHTNVGPHSDEAIWSRVVPFAVAGVSGFTLSTTDHLLHVIIHGLAFNESPTIRWITDALAILRKAGPPGQAVDWELFLEETLRRGLALPACEALDYLVAELDAPVPPWVRERLARASPNWRARLRYADLLQNWREVRSPGTLFAGVSRFLEGRPPLDALRVGTLYFRHRLDQRGAAFATRHLALSLAGLLPGRLLNAFRRRGWLEHR